MTKLDAGLITSLPASDPGSAAVWGSKRINPRPQFCLYLAWSGCPSNDDDDDDDDDDFAVAQCIYSDLLKTNQFTLFQQMSIIKKTFFLYEVIITACLKSLLFQQIFSPKQKKVLYCLTFCFFFYLKRGNFEAASPACITDFVNKSV